MTARFNLPIDISRLENDRLKLVPFEDNLAEWADLWVTDANAHPENYTWLTYGPFANGAAYVTWYEATMRPSTHEIIFAILLKAGSVTRKDDGATTTTTFTVPANTFAGIAGLGGLPDRATADLGQMLLTRFQRTFVGTHANALLLHHLLDSPNPTHNPTNTTTTDLNLRRVQWQCNASNAASIRAAQRLGFTLEGVMRWAAVLRDDKTGSAGAGLERERDGMPRGGWDGERGWGPGRHTAVLSICWEDWVGVGDGDGGVRAKVDALVARR